MSKFVCFIGIDGSGKTSHIMKTVSLINKRCGCQLVRCGAAIRFITFPFFLISRSLGLTAHYDEKSKHLHTSRYPSVYRNKALSVIWPYLVFIDMFILVLFRIKTRLMLGYTIFSDRGLHDVLVETMVATGDYDFYKTKFAHIILSLVVPDLVIMLDVPEEEALRRKDDIPNIEFLRTRKALYLKIASHMNIPVVDANRSFDEVHTMIESLVKPLLLPS
jgi:dTMP kinase